MHAQTSLHDPCLMHRFTRKRVTIPPEDYLRFHLSLPAIPRLPPCYPYGHAKAPSLPVARHLSKAAVATKKTQRSSRCPNLVGHPTVPWTGKHGTKSFLHQRTAVTSGTPGLRSHCNRTLIAPSVQPRLGLSTILGLPVRTCTSHIQQTTNSCHRSP